MNDFRAFGTPRPQSAAKPPGSQPATTAHPPRHWHGTGAHGLFYPRLQLPGQKPHTPQHRAEEPPR